MFDSLSESLGGVFDRLTGRGSLSAKDVKSALREVRVALLEADVALPVVRDFIASVEEDAVGDRVLRSVTPGQQVVKIVHDGLVDMLGGEGQPEGLNLKSTPPVAIMMAGLQGSGKTTTAGKLALRLRTKERKKVLLASLDTRRPAAMDQLAQLAIQAEVDSLPIQPGQLPVQIAKRALDSARKGGYDVVILDTAGRTSIDEELMVEAAAIANVAKPAETLLVADSLTGQDAVETAERFHERLPLTGLVLTRMDGDGRGGAALSMRAVTGLPIKFLGVSEKLDGIDVFDAQRIAGRILGQGDVVSLVEKAAEVVDKKEAEKLARKMKKGTFDLEDLAGQLKQMQKMGGLQAIMGLIPGMGKMAKQVDPSRLDDSVFNQQLAIISSMTPKEREKPAIIKASRKKRIAAGSGTLVQNVNQLLKMHKQMAGMMKKVGKGGRGNPFGGMGGMGGMPGGGMPEPSEAELAALEQKMKTGTLPGLGGMGGLGGGSLPGLPGLPKKK